MDLESFLSKIKGEIMETKEKEIHKKEIIVKGVRAEDHPKVGPKLGIVDREGVWYNTLRAQWTKIDGAWEALSKLVAGDRLDLSYTFRPYIGNDGTAISNNDIVGFEPVIRKEDEVKPVTAASPAPQGIPGETLVPKGIVPETGARQTCLNCATQLEVAVLAASVAAGVPMGNLSDPIGNILGGAKKLYAALKETW
jgi:hypothetical protein